MDRACSTHGRDEKFIQSVCWEILREDTTRMDIGVDGSKY